MKIETFLTRKYGLKGRSAEIRDFILNRAEDTLELIGELVEGEAKLRCPVGIYPEGSGRVGGRLRGSITHATQNEVSKVEKPAKQEDAVSKPTGSLTVYIGTAVEYAPYVCFGTQKMSAQPFLRPALLENEKRIRKFIKDQMKLR